MSEDKSPQSNNNYKKDINFLDEDLAQSIKATAQVQDVKNKVIDDKKVVKSTKEKDDDSWLTKMIHHNKQPVVKNIKPKSPKQSNVKFKSGGGQRFNLDIDIEDVKTSKKLPPLKPHSKFHPPEPVVPKPEGKILKEEVKNKKPLDLDGDKITKNSLSLPSIKDLIDSDSGKLTAEKISEKETSDFDVNLIPAELRSVESSTAAIKKISIVAGVSILFIVIIFFVLNFAGSANKKEIVDIQKQVEQYENEIQESRETIEKLANFTDQTKKVSDILVGRELWSSLFNVLEEETIPEVYYTSINVSENDNVTLQVVARSYHDMARQYKIFDENTNIINLNMDSANLDVALWEEYTDLAKAESEKNLEAAKLGKEVATTTQFTFDQDILKSLLTVESTISFKYIINPTDTELDKYE